VPVLGSHDGPATTGSIVAAVEVHKPLPDTLAYSDATKIGQAAAAINGASADVQGDWVNSATGSAGTVEAGGSTNASAGEAECRPFSTIVTSIGGVHRYSGKLCPGKSGRSIVQIEPSAEAS
nr:hypothetical protein [Hyphomicrobiales bacterium]